MAPLSPPLDDAPEQRLTPAALGLLDTPEPLWIVDLTWQRRSLRLRRPFVTHAGRCERLQRYYCRLTLRTAAGATVTGTGECAPLPAPWYDGECQATVAVALRFIRAALLHPGPPLTGVESLIDRYRWIVGHWIARAGVEGAYWEAVARWRGLPVYRLWGGTRTAVAGGVSLGLETSDRALLDRVARALDQPGVSRIKLKIAPGRDVAPVALVRRRYPDLALQVDANAAYNLFEPRHLAALAALDDLGLLLIEQPGPADDVFDHARQLARLRTPICLDESIRHATHARQAIAAFAAQGAVDRLAINIKPGRVGGYLEAIRIAALCGHCGVSTWCGGLFESALGKRSNLHFASRAEVDLPGDHLAPGGYFVSDVGPPPAIRPDGLLEVPEVPGWGLEVSRSPLSIWTMRGSRVRR